MGHTPPHPTSNMAAMAVSSAMTSTFLAGQKISARAQRVRNSRAARVVRVRAEEEGTEIATKDRSKDKLYFASEQSLSYLDGSLAGDFVAPEILGKAGLIPESTGLVWFKNGVVPPSGSFEYWCDPFSLFFGQLVLMSFAEHRRIQDYRNPGSMKEQYFLGLESVLGGSGDPAYPGGQFFNMFNLGKDDMDTMKLKEVKNGRLAMLAMLGYYVQALVTGTGPVENWLAHVGDATSNNFMTSFGAVGGSF